MDSRPLKPAISKGSKKYAVIVCPERIDKGEEGGEEKKRLLPRAKSGGGGTPGRRKRGMKKRRVQWNDRNGRELVEVLEFERREAANLKMLRLKLLVKEPKPSLYHQKEHRFMQIHL